jgi:hypothetical protein
MYDESVIYEADEKQGIPDSALRDIFAKVVTEPEASGVELPPEVDQKLGNDGDNSKDDLNVYYAQWNKELSKADDNKRLDLIKSMVDKLSIHHNDDQWKQLYKKVENDIQKVSSKSPDIVKIAIDKIEKGEVFENKRIKHIRSVMETNMYGRRRRV